MQMLAVNLQAYMSESDLEQGEIDICSTLSGFLPSSRCGMKSSLITSISQTFMPAVRKIKNSHLKQSCGTDLLYVSLLEGITDNSTTINNLENNTVTMQQ